MATGYEGGFTRRQELTCTETEMAAYADVVLYENEHIYIKMNSGMIRLKIGDGKTGLLNLPWAKVFDATLDDVEAIVGGFASRVETNTNRIENLEAAISPEIVTPVTDSTVAYTKTVPNGALPNAAITEIGGMSYVKNGVLVDSKVEAIESVGTNLLNTRLFLKDTTTIKENDDGSFTITNKTSTAISVNQSLTRKLPAGTYTIKNESSKLMYVMLDVTDYSRPIVNGEKKTFTYNGETYLNLLFADFKAYESVVVKIMLNRGSTILPYSPYFRETLPIPGDALDGFGQGVSKDYCNKIVLDPLEGVKKYVLRTTRKTFYGTEGVELVNYIPSSDFQQFNVVVANAEGGPAVSNKFPSTSGVTLGKAFGVHAVDTRIIFGVPKSWLDQFGYIAGDSAATIAAFKAFLKSQYDNGDPIIVEYPITPTETDISAYFTDDNLLRVVAGGTITAVNEFGHEVPFTVKYTIKGA